MSQQPQPHLLQERKSGWQWPLDLAGYDRAPTLSHVEQQALDQFVNAKQPLTLFELQAWLGHHSPTTTQHYAKITPTKLAKAYEKAGYFGRNIRTIEVLIDQDAIKSGAAAKGEPWRFFDLGHGYCLYEFFDNAVCLLPLFCAILIRVEWLGDWA